MGGSDIQTCNMAWYPNSIYRTQDKRMCTNKDSQACKGWGHWDKQEIVYNITKDLAIKEVQRGR